MTTTSANPPQIPSPAKYANGAEWLHALGDVPPQRIIMDPPPGTATEQDLLRMVEAGDRLVELIDGTLVEKPVGWDEGKIAANVIYFLQSWVLPRNLGSVAGADATLRMKGGRVRLPDVTFVTAQREAALPTPHPAIPDLAPDLAVEVLSESNTRAEMRQKLKEYFESGTQLAWFIDPATRTVAVYDRPSEQPARVVQEREELDGGNVLPGFKVPVSDLFIGVKS